MSKKRKKRDKPYTGADAKHPIPTVHHYTAVVRSPLGQWWHEHRRVLKISTGITAGVIFFGWLLLEVIHLIFFKSIF